METHLDNLDALYQEVILDHYRNPRNHRLVHEPDLKAEGFNPFCGDRVIFTGKIDQNGRMAEIGFEGDGCAISQASASIMSELLKGLTLEGSTALANEFRGVLRGEEQPAGQEDRLGALVTLTGVKMFPVRVKCALLAWVTLQDAITEYDKQEK